MSAEAASAAPDAKGSGGFLDLIERVGNKVPHPAILFLALCLGMILLSQVFYWLGASATYEVVKPIPVPVEQYDIAGSVMPGEQLPAEQADATDYKIVTETVEAQGLLTADGIRFLFTSFVRNFMGFTAMGIILIVMIGVGVAELSGLIASLIRKLVAVSSVGMLTYIIVFLGIISSIASDAGYLVLIPLGAAAFKSVGRHPLAGMAAAFAGVAGGFGVNLLITPTDAVLTEITNEAIPLVNPAQSIDIAANLYFGIGSTIVLTVVLAIMTTRVVEKRLGTYDPALAPSARAATPTSPTRLRTSPPSRTPRVCATRESGRYWCSWSLACSPSRRVHRCETRSPGRSSARRPFMDSLIVIIALVFLGAGLGYGRGAGDAHGAATKSIAAIQKSWAGLAGLLFLFLLIAQFIAYFNYSNLAQIAAVRLGDTIESMNVGTLPLLLGAILITAVVGIIMPQAIAKWALLAPIFIPLFLQLGVAPAAVLAAYRVGDSPVNIVTPIMAYFPLIVVFAARYDKRSGIGTIIALMLPYFVALTVVWTLFFAAWYLLGIPWGP